MSAAQRNHTRWPFGPIPTRDSPPEDFQERLQSVWRWIVRLSLLQITRMYRKQPASSASYDAEDLIQEVVLRLIERDHYYDPARASYMAFATMIFHQVCAKAIEEARVVRAPVGVFYKLKELQKCEADGTLTTRKKKTLSAIREVLNHNVDWESAERILGIRDSFGDS